MRIAVWVVTWILAAGSALQAQSAADLLFKGHGDSIPAKDRAAIAEMVGFQASPDGQKLMACETEAYAETQLADLDGDGRVEVFVQGGNTCTSGHAGSSLWLFVKDDKDEYVSNLGFPAGGYDLLETKHAGYPDIKVGGPGWCSAVWRWNGKAYDFLKNVPEQPGGCDGIPG